MTLNSRHAESRAVLVTGGAGYIGSHACKALFSAGYLPLTYDSLVYGHEWAARKGLGWKTRIAGLDEIVRTAWGWHQNAPSVTGNVETAAA